MCSFNCPVAVPLDWVEQINYRRSDARVRLGANLYVAMLGEEEVLYRGHISICMVIFQLYYIVFDLLCAQLVV